MKKFSAQPYWILLYRLELDRKTRTNYSHRSSTEIHVLQILDGAKMSCFHFWGLFGIPHFLFPWKMFVFTTQNLWGQIKKNPSAFWSILKNYFSGFCNIQVLFQCEMKAQFKLTICTREVLSSSLPYPWQMFLINWYHFAQSWYWQQ